jgi:uncharacterized protein (DUF1499 family)
MQQAQTPSKLVNWTGYLAIALLVMLPLGVLTVRSGAWQQGLMLYALACLGSTLVFALCACLLVLPRFADRRSAIGKRSLAALPGAILLLSVVGGRGDYPPIHDISTDTINPPTFETAVSLRGNSSNSLEIKPDSIEQQRAAYPDLQTLQSTLSIESAYAEALRVAKDLGWEVTREDLNDGFIEAVAATAIMGFKDDVVIRLKTNEAGTLIDLRSVSRVGLGDIGANAKRIRAFMESFSG